MNKIPTLIPKIIHYCWFGGNAIDDFSNKCISEWQEKLPDYFIKKWDETNFDVLNAVPFVREAYRNKKWAFVSDYVRAYALWSEGGIYLDTDVEIKYSLDIFLQHRAFSGFERKGYPFTALWGSAKGHSWPKKILNYYDSLPKFTQTINTGLVSKILVKDYKINPNLDSLQEGEEGVFVYPSETFCVDLPINYACHHFHGSWLTDNDIKTHWKVIVKKDHFKNKYFQMLDKCDKAHQALEKSGILKWYSTEELLDEIKERSSE